MRVIAFPHNTAAYNKSLYSAMKELKVEVLDGDFSGTWILENVDKGDVIHIHWPSHLYSTQKGEVKAFLRFVVLSLLLKVKSSAFFWTAHNFLPHKRSSIPFLDVWGRKLIIRLSDRVFVHGEEVQNILVAAFPEAERKCVKIPHGNWINDFPTRPNVRDARLKLGLPEDAFIYLMFGYCQPYKNVEKLVISFQGFASESDYLLIAGNFPDEEYLKAIRKLTQGSTNIRIDNRFIVDREVPYYFSASDIMCIPYREILTSGSAMLALSFGKPVISIRKGFLQEVITEDVGILIDSDSGGGGENLTSALIRAKKIQWGQALIQKHVEKFKFEDAARIHLEEIECLGLGSR